MARCWETCLITCEKDNQTKAKLGVLFLRVSKVCYSWNEAMLMVSKILGAYRCSMRTPYKCKGYQRQTHNCNTSKENSKREAEVITTILLTSEAMKSLRNIVAKENLNQQLSLPICPTGKLLDLRAADQLNTKDISSAQCQVTMMSEFCC